MRYFADGTIACVGIEDLPGPSSCCRPFCRNCNGVCSKITNSCFEESVEIDEGSDLVPSKGRGQVIADLWTGDLGAW